MGDTDYVTSGWLGGEGGQQPESRTGFLHFRLPKIWRIFLYFIIIDTIINSI